MSWRARRGERHWQAGVCGGTLIIISTLSCTNSQEDASDPPASSSASSRPTSAGVHDGGEVTDNGGEPSGDSGAGALQCRSTADGQRLQGIRYVGTDGSVKTRENAWFDTELDVECEPTTAIDGVLRCLPMFLDPSVTDRIVYNDPDCAVPVVFGPSACTGAVAKYSTVVEPAGESDDLGALPRSRVFEVGEPLGVFDAFYDAFGGGCQLTQLTEEYTFNVITGELSPERFVALEEMRVVGDRYRDLQRVWSDGATDYAGVHYDHTLAAECRRHPQEDVAVRCYPGYSGDWTVNATPECTGDIMEVVLGVREPREEVSLLGGETLYHVDHEAGLCDFGTRRVHSVTDSFPGAVMDLFAPDEEDPATCVDIGSGRASSLFLKLGPEIPPEELLSAELAPATCASKYTSGSRLQVLGEHWNDGAVDGIGFFDPEIGAKCKLGVGTDGVVRCIPIDLADFTEGLFADPECTRPAAHYICAPSPGDPYDNRDYAEKTVMDTESCWVFVTTIYSLVGDVLEGGGYSVDGSGACVWRERTGFVRALGSEIPPESFVAFDCPGPHPCHGYVR